ncbi:uncharacterized protein LOC110807491 [Carica papaya]|uniref:uncharacterized protein LOC110807491 n=1 Tax=Carica papaya TaxID=3649 RepID=UPI000B8CBA5D|nr:uncharacterized protein LOC110807491 [Carica papaya]
MAIELCSENLTIVSPRISFSYCLLQSETLPVEQLIPLRKNSSPLDSTAEFDFCIFKNFSPDLSPADEIFLNGKIIPLGIKNNSSSADQERTSLPPPPASPQPCLFLDGINSNSRQLSDKQERFKEKRSWFKRSCSLNSCVGGHGRSLCSLPVLSRSKSIGFPQTSKNNSKKHKLKKKKKKKMGSNQKYSGNGHVVHQAVNGSILNVPLANIFCLGFFAASIKKKKR